MRKWYKYLLNYENDLKFISIDNTFSEHKKSMNGYESDRGYGSKEEFFKSYFYDAHHRFKYYHDYIKNNIKKGEEVLSIGSGRCVNELLLIEDGFNIVCSDLEQPCREETLRLFPNLKFVEHNVASMPFKYRFDCIISLSLFYLFDEDELLKIFKNIYNSLKSGGAFIFDPGGAMNNYLTYIIDGIICKYEVYILFILQRIRQRQCVVTKKHVGYRSKNDEIISIAEKAGFILSDFKNNDYLTEIEKRSLLLSKFPKNLIPKIGKIVPYVRMFNFVKK